MILGGNLIYPYSPNDYLEVKELQLNPNEKIYQVEFSVLNPNYLLLLTSEPKNELKYRCFSGED